MGPATGPFRRNDAMKRMLTLAGFLIAGTAALSLGCQKRETTTTTTGEAPASATPEPAGATTPSTAEEPTPTAVP
jgi:hypothetical protein